jgi:hypothetical protein
MGHNMATWKLLEEMLIELRKKGVSIPSDIMEDLRAAKSMITLSFMKGGGEAMQKTEEYTANVEAYLINEAQKIFDSETADQWLRRLEDANAKVCDEAKTENNFVTGVPKDQKWIRVEAIETLPIERIYQLAKELKLQVKSQNDGRLLVYGQNEDIKILLKKMTADAAVKK